MGGEGMQRVAALPGFTCWDGLSEETLEAALSPPAAGCIEVDLIDECDKQVVFTQDAPGHLALVVTTPRARFRRPSSPPPDARTPITQPDGELARLRVR